MAWYKEWFGEEYLELYAHRDRGEAEVHIDFAESLFAGDKPDSILDLACGAGRHTEALRRRGYRTLGLDLSLTLLLQRPRVPCLRGDMCCLPIAAQAFDWVLNFFTSFGYFESEEQNFRVLEEVARVLKPGGHFLIDLFNVDRVLAQLRASETTEMGGREVEIERWYDARTNRINKRIHVLAPQGPGQVYLESVRAYRAEEVVDSLGAAGLEVRHRYGSFDGERLHRESERVIFVAQRPA